MTDDARDIKSNYTSPFSTENFHEMLTEGKSEPFAPNRVF